MDHKTMLPPRSLLVLVLFVCVPMFLYMCCYYCGVFYCLVVTLYTGGVHGTPM
jgi:hypothetical protein